MSKPNLLVVSPPGHYFLRNLDPIRDQANISVGADEETLRTFGPSAEIVLYSGFSGTVPSFHEVWKYTKNVRWIHSLSAGVEKILFPELIQSPVPITNARGVFKRSLAEFVVLGMLYFYKEVRRLVANQQNHRWDDFLIDWLPGKIMGVIGFGEIGRECAILAKALGVKVYAVRRNPELSADDPMIDRVFPSTGLPAMLSEVDVVVCAAPLTNETRHLLSDAQFQLMKPNAIVMNVGRGPVIDQAALVRALEERRIAAAALDVFEEEPLPEDHPLWDMENVLISPHCTDRTREPDWLDLTGQFFVENFRRYIAGEPLQNVVDKKAGY